MTADRQNDTPRASRRDFLKVTAVAGTALAANMTMLSNVHAAGSDTIKVGLIGCGGRGSGAAENVLHSARNVEIVAIGDVFKFRADGLRRHLLNFGERNEKVKQLGNRVNLPEDRCFVGLDAYQRVIGSDANYIILATPPGFRPIHLEAAVAAGKNIFTEKPVGTDGPGIRKVLDAYEKAKEKKLAIVAGTQRRHQLGYLETMKRVLEGAIGEIVALRCYWNQGNIWFRKRDDLARHNIPDSDLAYQLHNWYHFGWVCGDHIVEQHVHNLDVCNWAMGTHPVRAVAMGGRTSLPMGNPRENGNIFDHFAVDYEYPHGVHMLSMCRQIDGCENNVSEALVGNKGTCRPNNYVINNKRIVARGLDRKATDPYVQEHTDLIASIREGKPLNELKQVAESTLTAILGRNSAYSGKALSWNDALSSKDSLMPEKLDWNSPIEVRPVAMPGQTRV
jgi:predicted dehydrogenase